MEVKKTRTDRVQVEQAALLECVGFLYRFTLDGFNPMLRGRLLYSANGGQKQRAG
jgi:hypothetical protein